MWIVSTDEIFAEAVQITLRQAGIAARITDRIPASAAGSEIILDLDSTEMATPIPAGTWTISRDSARNPRYLRPFLLSAFAKEIAAVASADTPAVAAADDAPFLSLTDDGVWLQGRAISLSPSERALLALLIERGGECVSTEEIDDLWAEKGGNTTAVYIRYLRKKLDESCGLRLIRTVRGRGYCLCLPK